MVAKKRAISLLSSLTAYFILKHGWVSENEERSLEDHWGIPERTQDQHNEYSGINNVYISVFFVFGNWVVNHETDVIWQ